MARPPRNTEHQGLLLFSITKMPYVKFGLEVAEAHLIAFIQF